MPPNQRRPVAANYEAPKSDELGHILSHLPRSRKLAVALAILTDLIGEDETPAPSDDLLTVEQIQTEYGMGRAALDARGVPRARVGRAYKWRRSAVEASIQAQPAKPRLRKALPIGVNEDPIDAMVRNGELRAKGGAR